MPRGTVLSTDERAKITAYRDSGFSTREISGKMGRSQTVICNFLKLGDSYGKIAKYDRNKKLTPRQKRMIVTEAGRNHLFSSQIVTKLGLPVTGRRVRQILSKNKNLIFKKRSKKPSLTPNHKANRLDFAVEHVHWRNEWDSVLFSDEKKFNLDGPDSFQYYWHNKRFQEEYRLSRVSGGGGVMIWAGFSTGGKTELALVPQKMNSIVYIELLEAMMIEKEEELCGENFIFQQDNASIHSARTAKDFFREQNINVLDWPSRSIDLNPIENIWGILARQVYANGRQFNSVTELKTAIKLAWGAIPTTTLKNLV